MTRKLSELRYLYLLCWFGNRELNQRAEIWEWRKNPDLKQQLWTNYSELVHTFYLVFFCDQTDADRKPSKYLLKL